MESDKELEQEIPVEHIDSKGDVEASDESDIQDVEQLVADLKEAESRLAEFRDEALRARAELDNVRKRSAREMEKARKFALERIMGDLLDVSDSLDRGLEAARSDDASIDALLEGTELTARQLRAVLDKHGLREVDPKGERFDPELHEAISMMPSEDLEPNTVIEVVQKGYQLNERLIRPARVVVSA